MRCTVQWRWDFEEEHWPMEELSLPHGTLEPQAATRDSTERSTATEERWQTSVLDMLVQSDRERGGRASCPQEDEGLRESQGRLLGS